MIFSVGSAHPQPGATHDDSEEELSDSVEEVECTGIFRLLLSSINSGVSGLSGVSNPRFSETFQPLSQATTFGVAGTFSDNTL